MLGLHETGTHRERDVMLCTGKAPSLTRLASGECMPIFFSVDDSAATDIKGVAPGDTLLGAIKFESAAPAEDFIEGKSNW